MTTVRNALFWMLSLAGMLVPQRAQAWDPRVHELIPERALQGDPRLKPDVLPAVTRADLDAFRLHVDALFRAHPDEKVRAEYVRRWPTPDTFDARAFKTLMGLNPAVPVQGFDTAEGLPGPALQVMRRAAAQPDVDGRNRDRLALDEKGQPRTLPDGRVVPADPVILNLGDARGPTSQFHAHFGFADVPTTEDPDMLKRDPRRFAWALGWPGGPVKTFGREMVQAHYDAAILAAMARNPSLAHLFFGHALHYLADVGHQTQTVQVGLADFVVNANLLHSSRALRTLGGYLGELKTHREIALDLLVTHRTLANQLATVRILDAASGKEAPEAVKAALAALTQDDGLFKQDMEMAVARSVAKATKRTYLPMASLIASRLIDNTAGEGSEVYRHIVGAVKPQVAEYGVRIESPVEDIDSVLADPADPYVKAHFESFYWLHAKAFARIGSATRLLFTRFLSDTTVANDDERNLRATVTAQGLLAARLKELSEQDARLDAFLKAPPVVASPTEKRVAWLLGPLLAPILVVVGLFLLLKWMRRPVPQTEKDSASYLS